jgi:hypothetical protein
MDRKWSDIMPVSQYRNSMCGVLFVLACTLPAHGANEDAIARCARIATVGDRILCLEDALRQASDEASESDPTAADDSPVSAEQMGKLPPKPVVRESAAEADVVPASATRTAPSPLSETEVPPPAAQADSISPDATSPTNDNYGLKEQRPPKESMAIQVTVTSVRKNLSNRFVFETQEGQVWLQTDQRTVRYGDAPFEAEIRPASMGSYFLKPDSGGASVRVRREK